MQIILLIIQCISGKDGILKMGMWPIADHNLLMWPMSGFSGARNHELLSPTELSFARRGILYLYEGHSACLKKLSLNGGDFFIVDC